jgi:hypothetical protein
MRGFDPSGYDRGGRMLGDFQPHKMRDIIGHFADGAHDDELNEAFLHARNQPHLLSLDSEFYLLRDWEYEDLPEVEAFARAQGFDPDGGQVGQLLADVLGVARRQRPDATGQDYLDAYNHYLEYDSFLDWSCGNVHRRTTSGTGGP